MFYAISLASLCFLGLLIGFLIFQQFYSNYYYTSISILIITVSYGTAATFILFLSWTFFSWYQSNRNLIVFLYSISMLGIAFNLLVSATYVGIKLNDLPARIGEYVGSSGDASGGRYPILTDIYKVSSIVSFISIWVTTAIMMYTYRDKLIATIAYWLILSVPLIYFLIAYSFQFTLGGILRPFMENDPVTISIAIGVFLSLSKPIGGLTFAIAFWNTSRIISYERNIKLYMIISGWGILLIFSANQASAQIVSPFPAFGVATTTVLNIAAYLMLLGIYNSATLVSANNGLRIFIHKHALRLLNPIGQAELQKEIQRTVKQISDRKEIASITTETSLELDEEELKKYLEYVIREVKKKD